MSKMSFGVSFTGGFQRKDDGKYCGRVSYLNGVELKYSLTPQAIGEYAYRGTLSILKPGTGEVLDLSRKKIREINARRVEKGLEPFAAGSEKLKARTNLYIKRSFAVVDGVKEEICDEEAMKKYIALRAQELYAENVYAVLDSYTIGTSADEMYIPVAIMLYGSHYLEGRGSAQTKAESLRRLNHAQGYFAHKPIGALTSADVNKAIKALGSNADIYIGELQHFVDFLFSVRFVSGATNPFHARKKQKKKRDTDKKQEEAMNTDILSSMDERLLRERIYANWKDPGYLGLLFVMETRFTYATAVKIKWGAVELNPKYPNAVFLNYRRDDIGGATHNFTFPIVGAGAEYLRKHMQYVQEQVGAEDISAYPIIHKIDSYSEAMDKVSLGTFCREALKGCGKGYAHLIGSKDKEKTDYLRLLQHTYDHHRQTTFGLGNSPGLLCFLRHEQIKRDVLADHYRSMTDNSARYMLVTALSQPKNYEPSIIRENNISCSTVDAQVVTKVAAPDSKKRTQMIAEIDMKCGDKIDLSSFHGMKVHYEAE